jgi:hypothetical protein
MELVEVVPGVTVSLRTYVRVRAQILVLLVLMVLLIVDRSVEPGTFNPVPDLRSELAAVPALSPPGAVAVRDARARAQGYLRGFERDRMAALDLLRYATTVAPPTVQPGALSLSVPPPWSGVHAGAPAARIQGVTSDPAALHRYVRSLRAMVPHVSVEQVAPLASEPGRFSFVVTTDRPIRTPAAAQEEADGEP